MNWNKLDQIEQIEQIKTASQDNPVLIFKHSTRCSVSSMAENRLERAWKQEEVPSISPYHLDLIQHRDISQALASVFSVPHESPQILIIANGKCVYDTSHMGISYNEIKKVVVGLSVA